MEIITGIISFIILGLFAWVGRKIYFRYLCYKVHKWLKANTKDKPGETHVDTITIAKGSKLSEEQVRNACISSEKIYRYSNGKEQWSIWREQPQSCYEGLTEHEILSKMVF